MELSPLVEFGELLQFATGTLDYDWNTIHKILVNDEVVQDRGIKEHYLSEFDSYTGWSKETKHVLGEFMRQNDTTWIVVYYGGN